MAASRRRPVSVSVDWNVAAWVEAATVMYHGQKCSTVPAPGPLLPAEAETRMPAS